MNIIINGTLEKIEKDSIALPELLTLKKVEAPDMVSVQLNGEFVLRADFEKTVIKENDEVDFLYFMGGGC